MTRPTLRQTRSAALLGLITLMLAACSVGSPAPMRVEVRDAATRKPVADATVRVHLLNFFLPIPPYETLNTSPPPPVVGRTDASGHAIIESRRGAPVELFIAAAGYPPIEITLESHPLDTPSDVWRRDPDAVDVIPAAGELLEVRLRPATDDDDADDS